MARTPPRGKPARAVPLNDSTIAILEQQRKAFRAKFGRYPRDDDPVFFDPDAETPQPISVEDVDELDAMLGELRIGPNLTFDAVRRHLEGIDRLIADDNPDPNLWLAAYMVLADLTREVIEQTPLTTRRYIPKAPPVYDFEPHDEDDTANVAYIRAMLPLARRDFAEYWGQYVNNKPPA